MNKRRIGLGMLVGLWVLSAGCSVQARSYQRTFYDLYDTVTTVVGMEQDEDSFIATTDELYARLKHYHQLYDIYHEVEGLVNLKQVNDEAGLSPVSVSQEIIDLLLYCKEAEELSKGKVNVGMGSVLSIWHEYREKGLESPEWAEIPPMDLLREAEQFTDLSHLEIDEENKTVYFSDPNFKLDVGAVAKGYGVQRACEELKEGYLINVGGNIYASGPKDRKGTPWRIGVKNPLDPDGELLCTLTMEKGAMVSSGDYQRFYQVGEQRLHHIIDPDTLFPARIFSGVTVVTEDSGMGDILSTALFLLPLEEGKKLVESLDHTEAIWVLPDGGVEVSTGLFNAVLIEGQV